MICRGYLVTDAVVIAEAEEVKEVVPLAVHAEELKGLGFRVSGLGFRV